MVSVIEQQTPKQYVFKRDWTTPMKRSTITHILSLDPRTIFLSIAFKNMYSTTFNFLAQRKSPDAAHYCTCDHFLAY